MTEKSKSVEGSVQKDVISSKSLLILEKIHKFENLQKKNLTHLAIKLKQKPLFNGQVDKVFRL